MSKLKAGLVGCGVISDIYLKNCRITPEMEIVSVTDQLVDKARQKAEEFQVPKVYTLQQLLDDHEIDIVLNLTNPAAHAGISLAALEHGKHVYSEKPIAVELEDGKRIVELARNKGLRVGVAPDTVLGGGIQTARQWIDSGVIGRPVAATAFMMYGGPESWHPDPAFLYKQGAGPMFDMGPYYLSALITLLGPIRRVTGSAHITYPERIITSLPRYGERIQVETPTHIAGVIDFVNGAVATLITSFDISGGTQLPHMEIYGSLGTLSVPDPNTFGGPVKFRRSGMNSEWEDAPMVFPHTENSRGLGLRDMVRAILDGSSHRASGELALHVLEAMHGFHIASSENRHYTMTTTCERPSAMDGQGSSPF